MIIGYYYYVIEWDLLSAQINSDFRMMRTKQEVVTKQLMRANTTWRLWVIATGRRGIVTRSIYKKGTLQGILSGMLIKSLYLVVLNVFSDTLF